MAENEILENEEQLSASTLSKMHKSYTKWSSILLVLGVLNLILSFVGMVNASSAVMFLITAAAMYFFRVPAMFPVIGVLLIWTALGNILAVVFNDQSFFAFDILIFLFLAYRAFRDFREFRSFETEVDNSPSGDMDDSKSKLALAKRVFPAGGCVVTVLSMVIFAFVWIGTAMITGGFGLDVNTLDIEMAIYTVTMSVCVLAFAVSLASILSGYKRKRLAVAGMVSAVIGFLCQLSFLPLF